MTNSFYKWFLILFWLTGNNTISFQIKTLDYNWQASWIIFCFNSILLIKNGILPILKQRVFWHENIPSLFWTEKKYLLFLLLRKFLDSYVLNKHDGRKSLCYVSKFK